MLTRILLVATLMLGGTFALARVAVPATTAAAPADVMCRPPAPLLPEETTLANKCLPRNAGCEYSHDCCSRICRTIRGSKVCS